MQEDLAKVEPWSEEEKRVMGLLMFDGLGGIVPLAGFSSV